MLQLVLPCIADVMVCCAGGDDGRFLVIDSESFQREHIKMLAKFFPGIVGFKDPFVEGKIIIAFCKLLVEFLLPVFLKNYLIRLKILDEFFSLLLCSLRYKKFPC